MLKVLRKHWPEYAIEAFGLGAFMVSAGVFTTLVESPRFPVREAIANADLRRFAIGLAMGLTAVAIIYSPWGKRSGAHINPAVTLTFFRLGKLEGWDALFYVLAQFVGGTLGVYVSIVLMGAAFTQDVNYVATIPGELGWLVAFAAEFLLSFGLMLMVLFASNTKKLAQYTGLFSGILVATYITFEAPLSGMSINPARTFASGFPGNIWDFFWIYYFAPPLGMLLASEIYLRFANRPRVLCSKLCPNREGPCLSDPCCLCPIRGNDAIALREAKKAAEASESLNKN